MYDLVDFENTYVRKYLSQLLADKTTHRNITFSTDSYVKFGKSCSADKVMTKNLLSVIRLRSRTAKDRDDRAFRTHKMAEVFTPAGICCQMINYAENEWFGKPNLFCRIKNGEWTVVKGKIIIPKGIAWQDFIKLKWLEIACGEAPYIVSRYDAATGEKIEVANRIGILDRKLRLIGERVRSKAEWLDYALIAYRSVYGYEWQGDNLLMARANLLLSFVEHYESKWGSVHLDEDFEKALSQVVKVIVWNFWQMDGLSGTVPHKALDDRIENQPTLFDDENSLMEKDDLKSNIRKKCCIHNWDSKGSFEYNNIKYGGKFMKFDFCIGNPPYQGDNHIQLYPDFYLQAKKIGRCVEMIFPVGWQEPKTANNLKKMNTKEVKQDKQIVFIDNIQNAFPSLPSVELANIIMWKEGYDNGLDGKQRILTNGKDPKEIKLACDRSEVAKPDAIVKLKEILQKRSDFRSMQTIVSYSKPYGIRKDVFDRPEYYGFQNVFKSASENEDDIKIYASSGRTMFVSNNFPFPKKSVAFDRYKVLVGSAWGNMSENTGWGGGILRYNNCFSI